MIKKIARTKIIYILLFCMSATPVFSQSMATPKMSSEEQQKFAAEMKEISPKFFQLQKRLGQILKEISVVVKDYKTGALSRKDAAERLRPLVKEQSEIMNDNEFVIAQRLFSLLSQ